MSDCRSTTFSVKLEKNHPLHELSFYGRITIH
jgi:hypothetical protein